MNEKTLKLIWLGLQKRYPKLVKVKLRISKGLESGQRGCYEMQPRPVIFIRKSIVKRDLKQAVATLFHEAAHALAEDGERIHHGSVWRRWAFRLGVPKKEVEWHCKHDHKGELWDEKD